MNAITNILDDIPWLAIAILALLVPMATAACLQSRRLLREENLTAKEILRGFWLFVQSNKWAQIAIATLLGLVIFCCFKPYIWQSRPVWALLFIFLPVGAVVLRWFLPFWAIGTVLLLASAGAFLVHTENERVNAELREQREREYAEEQGQAKARRQAELKQREQEREKYLLELKQEQTVTAEKRKRARELEEEEARQKLWELSAKREVERKRHEAENRTRQEAENKMALIRARSLEGHRLAKHYYFLDYSGQAIPVKRATAVKRSP